MDRMDLVTTTSRTPVKTSMVWIAASLLFVLGSWLIGQGLWIHMKATAAQWLLQHAWAQTLTTQRATRPWAWSDTWPVGRLIVPRLDINQIILADASGRSLAFGPGLVGHETFPDGESQSLLLSGHRDTHFSFLRDLQRGDTMIVQTIQGTWFTYVVKDITVVDSRTTRLIRHQEEAKGSRNNNFPEFAPRFGADWVDLREQNRRRRKSDVEDFASENRPKMAGRWDAKMGSYYFASPRLLLITCYPFDAILPGGPLRYVVTASPVSTKALTQRLRQWLVASQEAEA